MRRKGQIDVITMAVLLAIIAFIAYFGYLYFFHKEAFNALISKILPK